MREMLHLKNITAWRMGLFVVLAIVCTTSHIAAQVVPCDRVGKVSSVLPGCGLTVTDLNNGEVLRVIANTSVLSGGEVISFSTEPLLPSQFCPSDNLPVVGFTCLSSALPCNAQFGYLADANMDQSFIFQASVYDPLAQVCNWNFGDGMTATGTKVHHAFEQTGVYTVCLTTTDVFGCSSEHCENITVGDAINQTCGLNIEITAVGSQLTGKVLGYTGNLAYLMSSVKWYTNQSNQVIAEGENFTAPLPAYGTYLVCADMESTNPLNNDVCTATACKQLIVAQPGLCIYPSMVNATIACSAINAPVCGCDGITYDNECAAMAAGVASWNAGSCATIYGSCQAGMEADALSGSLDTGFTVLFHNQSSGEFTFLQLDYGDGSPFYESTQWDTVTHHYTTGSIYRTTLSVWKTESYVSSVTNLVATDALSQNPSNLPPVTDYVLPGDANGDKKANVYDLLNIGVGYNTDGAPRPNVSTDWTPQFAPNWSESVGSIVNYKHLDCDGNGTVHDFDADVIEDHYTPIDSSVVAWVPETPKVWVRFDNDTLIVDPNNPAPLEITADVMVGDQNLPR